MEPCIYENDIKELTKAIPRLEEKINNLVSTTASHTNVIANLINFQSLTQGEQKGRKDEAEKLKIANELNETKKRDNWSRGLAIFGFIVLIGLAVWNHKLSKDNNKKITTTETNTSMTNKMIEGLPITTIGGYVHYDVQRKDTTQIKPIK
jgi:hypothetical protein